ncbi:class I SAM-dependent methyltransferase [Enterovirga rhinocerotis]|uniref:SAM-dependent MidA family methyltransferase n=1 Tax=Enterovirga rhinocerotis TaxID=1339210 RepID=A0A4R7BU64_9HYPH|nr:SAM-dependent methyltransferase [Enterovirga rhinocerotis]TDR89308.1 SAM-dependent MidA family methyltransferase [Enterovirga rhinocerotis]
MSALLREIEAIIAAEGPIGVDRYMALALGHPEHGYYVTRDPLGGAGDFTTAPEISQMFGELLGLWACAVWMQMGRPSRFVLAELGPGRGTLMADALRAARAVPGFLDAAFLHFVETSPVLRSRQRDAVAGSGLAPSWHDGLSDLPEGAAIVLANEFLDALPIRQIVRGATGWHERLVGLAPGGGLSFGLAPDAEPGLAPLRGEPGDIAEICPAADAIVAALAKRLRDSGGAALLIDYGPAGDGFGDTLQAVRDHRFADPLSSPGEQDLTAHVRFGRLARIAVAAGAAVHGPLGQGPFLEALGIRERAEALARGRDGAMRQTIAAALARLTGRTAQEMGELFQAMAIADPRLGPLPGLPPRDGALPSG